MIKLGEYYIIPSRVIALREEVGMAGNTTTVAVWLDGKHDPIRVELPLADVLAMLRQWD